MMLKINHHSIDLLNILPDGIIIFDLDSKHILFSNKLICDTFEYTLNEIKQFSIYDLHLISLTEQTISKYLALTNNEINTLAFNPMITKQNKIKYFDVTGKNILFENKNCFFGIFRATDSIYENQIVLNKANKNILDIKMALDQSAIITITDPTGKILDVNKKICELSKYSQFELVGQDHRILNSGYHPKSFFTELWKCISEGKTWNGEICNKAKDGSFYWVETTITPFMGENGKPEQYISIRFDITAKKENEKLLQEQEKNLTAIIGSLDDIIFIIDEDYTFQNVWTKDHVQLFVPAEQFIGKKQADVFPGSFANLFEKQIDLTLKLNKTTYIEYPSIIKDDNSWYGAYLSVIYTNKNEKRKISMIVKNITSKKEIEITLKKSEERYRLLAENSNDWIYLLDENGKIEFSSQSSFEITGYSPEELLGRSPLEFFFPEDIPRIKGETELQLRKGETIDNLEYRFIKKNGSIEWFEGSVSAIHDNSGKTFKIATSARNITQRKRYSNQLKKAEKIAKIGSWELNIKTNELFWSDEIYSIFEINQTQLKPSYEKFLNYIHPDDKDIVNMAYSYSVENKTPYDITHRLLLNNNKIKYVREQAVTYYDTNNLPTNSLGTVQDITELHISQLKLEEINNNLERIIVERTESLLKEKWERINSDVLKSTAISNYQMLFEQIPLGVLVLEYDESKSDFIFKDVNPTACVIENISKNDIISRTLLEYYPFSKGTGIIDLMKEVLKTGETIVTPPRFYKNKDIEAWRELYMFKLITNEIVVVFNDVTEKVLSEQTLNKSLAEKEFLLNEVHHRVKNNLQIIIGLMQMQSHAFRDVPLVNNFLKQSENRVKAMGLIHETISETGQFTGINIVEYIKSLYAYLCNAIGKPQIEFHIESEISEISTNNASAFGIVLNEIISNSLKYAFPNNVSGKIEVKIVQFSEHVLQIIIRDNGKGIESISAKPTGLGIKLIEGLVKQQKGSVEIETFPSFAYSIKLPTTQIKTNS